ncbi:GIY-YIG nuclease family protein, partial [Carboxylicivirga linearis]
ISIMDNSTQWYVYALYSWEFNRLYVGMSINPEVRLEQHNSSQVRSTKAYVPWIQFYCEKVGDRKEARRRELELKSTSGRRYLRSLLGEGNDR